MRMPFSVRKIIFWSFSFFFMILLGLIALNYLELLRLTQILPTYYAKESCTCLFVHEESEKACHEKLRYFIPIQFFHVDLENKTTEVQALGKIRRARFIHSRLGCRLLD